MVKPHTNLGALLFLGALAAGALLLVTGLADTSPTRQGVRLPQRSEASFVAHARMGDGWGGPSQKGKARETARAPLGERIQSFIGSAEATANSALDQDHFFIQLYGEVQKLSGRTVVEDADPRYSVVKLTDGTLTFVNDQALDVSGHGRSVVRLSRALEKRDIPLLYVQAPQTLQSGDPRLPDGVSDYGNDYADQILAVLEEQGVAALDLRETLAACGRDWSSLFFRTDHHWTPEAGFLACQTIAETLRRDYGFTIPGKYTDERFFTRTFYSDYFLGSQGKRVGSLYAGVDDIELWVPTFHTNFTYSIPIYDMERTGPFEESLLFPERVEERDYFGGNPYTLYAGGDYPMGRIYNEVHPEGKRILLLRDSYACALTPFLALSCGELITIDLRYFHDDLLSYVDWLEPDVVLVMYTAGSLALDPLFDFFPAGDFCLDTYQSAPPIAQKPEL